MSAIRIAVITSDLSLGRVISNHLRRTERVELLVEELSDEAQAKIQLAKNLHQLAIVHNDLAADENSIAEAGRGTRLLKWLHENGSSTAKALICSVESSADLFVPEDTTILRAGSDFIQQLTGMLKNLMTPAKQAAAKRPSYVRVTVDLDEEGHAPYSLEGEGDSYQGSTGRCLTIDREKLKRLARRSKDIKLPSDTWSNDWLNLGQDVWDQVLRGDVGFWGALQNGLGHVDNDIQRMKFCFRISPALHPIAVEAIASTENTPDPDWWALKTPIYRSFHQQPPQMRGPLFNCLRKADSYNINCLIIQADVSGVVHGFESRPDGLKLDRLLHIAQETQEIERILRKHCSGRTLAVDLNFSAGEPFKDVISNLLKEEQWHIIHFAGHSFFDNKTRKGYIFFPGSEVGSPPETIAVADFCSELKGTQFFYLSSCKNIQADLILTLGENGIPSAAGYRWDVDDEKAAEYATKLYQQIFSERDSCLQHCLQHAFVETRKCMYKKYPDDPIWASPILLYRG
jgi:CHAT domain-containing protein